MNMRDYSTLHLDITSNKGTVVLLLFCISHCNKQYEETDLKNFKGICTIPECTVLKYWFWVFCCVWLVKNGNWSCLLTCFARIIFFFIIGQLIIFNSKIYIAYIPGKKNWNFLFKNTNNWREEIGKCFVPWVKYGHVWKYQK